MCIAAQQEIDQSIYALKLWTPVIIAIILHSYLAEAWPVFFDREKKKKKPNMLSINGPFVLILN